MKRNLKGVVSPFSAPKLPQPLFIVVINSYQVAGTSQHFAEGLLVEA